MRYTVRAEKPIRRVIAGQPRTLTPGDVVEFERADVAGLVQMGFLVPVAPPAPAVKVEAKPVRAEPKHEPKRQAETVSAAGVFERSGYSPEGDDD